MHDVVATKVVVHPLVLLSVVDHFNRMGKIGNQKRVVGVLLGSWRPKGVLDVSNSFAGKFWLVIGLHRLAFLGLRRTSQNVSLLTGFLAKCVW